jgi:branched-chain amino acid transport system substrate-binding protein
MAHRRFLVVCIVLGLLATACSGDTGPKSVKIAISVPLGIGIGHNMLNAAQLALDEAGGKAGDVTVELVVLDSSDPNGSPISTEFEEQNANGVIADETVVAYIGPLASSQSKESMPLLNEASITQISASATWPGLTKPGYGPGEPGIYYPTGQRHFFRVVPSDEVQGAASARWANEFGVQTVYILDDTTAYGSGVAGIFELTALDLGLEVLAHESYDRFEGTAAEYGALATRVVEADPDLVYLGGSAAEAGDEIIRVLREAGPDLQIMGPDAVAVDDLFDYPGADVVEGMYGTAVAIPADQLGTAEAAQLLANYQATYDEEPTPFGVATYEAMKVLLYAIERAEEPTREGVLDSMRNLGNFSGAFGVWHFDARGDTAITAISGMQIQDGAWQFVQVVR